MSTKTIVPQGKKTRASSRTTIRARLRAEEAIELRLQNWKLKDIAKKLGYASDSGAYKAIKRYLDSTAELHADSANQLRQEQLMKLDKMSRPLWQSVDEGDVQATAMALKIEESRRNLLGLDAPKQLEARIRLDIVHWNEVLKVFLEAYRDVHGHTPQADMLMDRIDAMSQERFG